MRDMMQKLKLTVNETKTRVCELPEEKFDFLGYTFGRCYSPKTGRAYLGTMPSKKRMTRVCEAISSETGRNTTLLDAADRGRQAQPHDGWVGQLLLSGSGQQSLPGGGATRPEEAASVAVRQAQGAWAGHRTVSGRRTCTMCWAWSA